MSSKPGLPAEPLTRRNFLKGVGTTVLVFALADSTTGVLAQQVSPPLQTSAATLVLFYSASDILTGDHPIEKMVSDQAWVALCTRYKDFPQRFGQLQNAMAQQKFTDIESFSGSPLQQDEGLRRTVMDIISAWYLGKVGEVKGESQTGGPEYVSYVDALLWQPTIHPGIIPSYSHGSPGWWGRLSDADLKV